MHFLEKVSLDIFKSEFSEQGGKKEAKPEFNIFILLFGFFLNFVVYILKD